MIKVANTVPVDKPTNQRGTTVKKKQGVSGVQWFPKAIPRVITAAGMIVTEAMITRTRVGVIRLWNRSGQNVPIQRSNAIPTNRKMVHTSVTNSLEFKCRDANFAVTQGGIGFVVTHDDVIKWKHFPRHWLFVREIPGEFPAQTPVTRNLDVFFDLRPNKLLSKQSWCWWFETPSRPLWRHRNGEVPAVTTKKLVSWQQAQESGLIRIF